VKITQRQLAFILMGGMAAYTFVRGLLNLVFGDPILTIVLTWVVSAIFGLSTWLYWRGWDGARFFATAGITLVIATALPLKQDTMYIFFATDICSRYNQYAMGRQCWVGNTFDLAWP